MFVLRSEKMRFFLSSVHVETHRSNNAPYGLCHSKLYHSNQSSNLASVNKFRINQIKTACFAMTVKSCCKFKIKMCQDVDNNFLCFAIKQIRLFQDAWCWTITDSIGDALYYSQGSLVTGESMKGEFCFPSIIIRTNFWWNCLTYALPAFKISYLPSKTRTGLPHFFIWLHPCHPDNIGGVCSKVAVNFPQSMSASILQLPRSVFCQ